MNKHFFLLLVAGSLALAAVPKAFADPAEAPAQRLTFEMSDGSRIIGTPAIDQLKIKTEYADLEIKLPLLRAIEFSGTNHAAQASLQNGDVLKGQLEATEIEVKAIFGQVTVPLAQVRSIRMASVGGPLPEGLVLHYNFDKDQGEKVTDTSSSGYDGTVHGATFVSGGKFGGAMSFNGNRQAVIAKSPAKLKLQDFTVMAWIKRESLEKTSNTWQDGVILAWGHGGYGVGIRGSNGRLLLSKVMMDAGYFAPCEIHDTDFHHVAVTKKGSKVVIYLDGIAYPVPDCDANFVFDSDAVAVGAAPDDNQEACFLGLINEVAVFNRPLSADEVKGVYESQK